MDVKSYSASFFVVVMALDMMKGQSSRRRSLNWSDDRSMVTDMALLNTSFQNKENSSNTGLSEELCHISRPRSTKGRERVRYISDLERIHQLIK